MSEPYQLFQYVATFLFAAEHKPSEIFARSKQDLVTFFLRIRRPLWLKKNEVPYANFFRHSKITMLRHSIKRAHSKLGRKQLKENFRTVPTSVNIIFSIKLKFVTIISLDTNVPYEIFSRATPGLYTSRVINL